LQPDILSQIEHPNEMSYQGIKSSCSALFDINQVSDNSRNDVDTQGAKDDETMDNKFTQGISSSKKY
jgi:hypothetical protein